jgi:hypothetical protein
VVDLGDVGIEVFEVRVRSMHTDDIIVKRFPAEGVCSREM